MPSKAALARPRDTSLAFRAEAIQGFLREAREPGTGKSQHRVVLKPQPYPFVCEGRSYWNASGCVGGRICISDADLLALHRWSVGDRIVVREAFATLGAGGRGPIVYRADTDGERIRVDAPWRSATQMRRDDSRLTLLVTEVRVERLADITDQDAIEEGALGVDLPTHGPKEATGRPPLGQSPRSRYRHLWDAQYGSGAFDTSPWVAALTLRPILANIDALPVEPDLIEGAGHGA